MNSITPPLIVIALCLVAFVGALYYELVKKREFTTFHVASIAPMIAVGITMLFFLDENVAIVDFGTDQFGHFGDFMGGILNPIFGFTTILLLLHQARQTKFNNQLDADVRNMESMYKLLEKAKIQFEARISAVELIDESGDSIEFFSIKSVFAPETLIKVSRREMVMQAILKSHDVKKTDDLEDFTDWIVFHARSDYLRIIRHYNKMLEMEKFEYALEDIANQYEEFIFSTTGYHFLSLTELAGTADLIRKHATKLV